MTSDNRPGDARDRRRLHNLKRALYGDGDHMTQARSRLDHLRHDLAHLRPAPKWLRGEEAA